MNIDPAHFQQLYIDGRWVAPLEATVLHDVINPANETVSHQIAFGGTADVDRAVSAAHQAFSAYSRLPLAERLALVERICAIYERRMEDIAAAITAEMGAPLQTLSRNLQAPVGLWHFQTAVASAKDFQFERQLGSTRILREPIGVCALITPWNWPMNQVICKIAPALVVGCTIVLKPSQNSPLSAIILAEILDEAGVPAGVFNMVQGQGGRLGNALAAHPMVDLVSLTGSNSAGAAVTRAAAESVKKVSLELGGKSANIILDDADLPKAITHAVHHMMGNTGQSCNAPSRLLVPAHRLDEVEKLAAEACAKLVVGDPLDVATTIGPVANERQYRKVQSMIDLGVAEGAKLICGGPGRPEGLSSGFYAKPTIFSRVHNTMIIAREEIFGPVLVIISYDDETEAIEIANDSPFGLSGYVFGGTIERAQAVAKRMRTGMVHLNGAFVDLTAPFGGYKQSGNGREWGVAGLEEFLETKSVMGWG
jgi:aldehyde dehydrogenase (NAD+)/betaine-aldehyde dehydrogenase